MKSGGRLIPGDQRDQRRTGWHITHFDIKIRLKEDKMRSQPHDPLTKESPLERIFRKLIGRKMTTLERVSFHLKSALKPVKRKSL
jgi:hypothetical protein